VNCYGLTGVVHAVAAIMWEIRDSKHLLLWLSHPSNSSISHLLLPAPWPFIREREREGWINLLLRVTLSEVPNHKSLQRRLWFPDCLCTVVLDNRRAICRMSSAKAKCLGS
jgi:hypothetical protein